ncbi:MAG: DNA double-strand break repair nuclease NurA [Anaerolineaceae bacterium]|nr:DNA double-strand break repair nuclease NurA [Anaerolineaceae bacterium]
MALEFNKIVDQVSKMGRMLDELDFDLGGRLQVARERFAAASDLDFIHRRINLTRQPDISGYRGAAPLDAPYHEPINAVFPAPKPAPASGTVIAADGSQIYPNEQSPFHYFLINTGLFVYHHGSDETPLQLTIPQLFFHKEHVHDKSGRLIRSRTVDARRTVTEMQQLGKLAWELRDQPRPLIALYDNHLMFSVNADITGHEFLMNDYQGALVHLYDTGALLAGYVDNPTRSRVVIRLLYLLSLTDAEVYRTDLSTGGDLEGLRDIHLFDMILKPGERSALMVQNSPRNLKFRQRGESYEIAYFYLKVSTGYQSSIARVDIPMWVARDKTAVTELHGLLIEQCRMQGRNPYPYALTRADELAVVTSRDKAKLDEMIALELRRKGLDPHPFSAKSWGKELARSTKRAFEI